MLLEASLDELNEWRERKKSDANLKLVCVMRYYPRWVGKQAFDLNAPALAPPCSMLKNYQYREEKYLNIAATMRAWGENLEERKQTAKYKAFVDAFGADAVYYRRYLKREPKARKFIAKIKSWLENNYTVVLFCVEKRPPCHRFILMQILLGRLDLARILKERKYAQEYLDFAWYVQNRFRIRRRREV